LSEKLLKPTQKQKISKSQKQMSPLEQKRARTRKFLNFKNPNTDVANINKTLTKANGKRDKQIDTQTRLQISQNVFKQKNLQNRNQHETTKIQERKIATKVSKSNKTSQKSTQNDKKTCA